MINERLLKSLFLLLAAFSFCLDVKKECFAFNFDDYARSGDLSKVDVLSLMKLG